jgi:hypothetical protein
VILSAFITAAWGQQFTFAPSALDSHPTVAEFREEISRAKIVVRGRIVKILRRRDGQLGDEDVIIQPIRIYKGAFQNETPCVRLEYHQAMERKPGVRYPNLDKAEQLPDVGAEVILPLDVVYPYAGAPPLNGEKYHYFAKFYYCVAQDETISSLFGFPPEMRPYLTLPAFEKLIVDEVNRPHPKPAAFKTAEVLFADDFNDGSLAGWTFLEGMRGMRTMRSVMDEGKPATGAASSPAPNPWNSVETVPSMSWVDETWVGAGSVLHNMLPDGTVLPDTRMTRDPATGMIRGEKSGTLVEIGVVNGRLRLRGGFFNLHLIAVAGDPEWTDYQLDVDMVNCDDPAMIGKEAIQSGNSRLGELNYKKFAAYGRLNVPNLPYTSGEHSFISAEFGNFSNYDVSEMTFLNDMFQLRCKYPESPLEWRDYSVLVRKTRILDYQAWPAPSDKQIHVTAKYFGRHVEGWVDGIKVLEGEIPEDHPGAKHGRIGLWTMSTMCEFDNVKVTRLVPAL